MANESAQFERNRSLLGKLGREAARLAVRRPASKAPPRAMVSFTFDDAPASAAQVAAPVLETAGFRGVYFVAGGYMDGADGLMAPYADWAAVKALARRGHEIACHTHGHRNCAVIGPAEAMSEAERNAAAFAQHGLAKPLTFAYPFGDVSALAKAALAPRFKLLRATHPGLIERGGDLNQTPAVAIEGPNAAQVAGQWLERAKARGAWLILYTHDVTTNPSPYGCTPAAFQAVVERTRRLGLEVVTVAEGAARLGA
ncbi:MAG TPA: polysaccharide deacetylase family protein [Caulobacteraceae bacterium]|jgi:peptidoglycan/xylan/chitin deacetylase (PgdA/CDA1 family)